MDLRLARRWFRGQGCGDFNPRLRSLSSWGETEYGRIRINIAWKGRQLMDIKYILPFWRPSRVYWSNLGLLISGEEIWEE